jgi:hypothetical protein
LKKQNKTKPKQKTNKQKKTNNEQTNKNKPKKDKSTKNPHIHNENKIKQYKKGGSTTNLKKTVRKRISKMSILLI